MFVITGMTDVAVDSKGRFLMPAFWKSMFTQHQINEFVIKRHLYHSCLELIPISVWNEELEKLNKLNRFNKQSNDFIRFYMSGVRVIEFDKVGRIQIPKDLFEYAEIKTTAVLSSSIDRLEIWDKVQYENYLQSHSDEFQKFAEDFLGKSFMADEEDKL